MMKRTWSVIGCLLCFAIAGCTPDSQLTTSGSEMWSRGVILDTTQEEMVAVAAWGDETFVAWFGDNGAMRLAHLDAALNVIEMTDVSLSAAFPHDLRMTAAAADPLHVTWVDSIDGHPTLVYAAIAAGQEMPLAYHQIPLAEDAFHVEVLLNPQGQRMEIFWSDLSSQNEGLYHRAVSLTGDEMASPVHLTDTGWQPGATWDTDGQISLAWADEGVGGYATIWYARFAPHSQSLGEPYAVAEVRMRRGTGLEGPEVGAAAGTYVVTWGAGDRRPVVPGVGDYPSGSDQLGGRFGSLGDAFDAVDGDLAYYAIVPPETTHPPTAHSLLVDPVVATLGEPRLYPIEGKIWVVYSGYAARRSTLRLQVLAMSLSAEGNEAPVLISRTQSRSLYPDLAVAGDMLRAVWLESIGNETYQVVVASTESAAREALGGFLWAEWWQEVGSLATDAVGLLGFLPLVLGWTVLPLGLVLVGAWVSSGEPSRWQAALWLGGAVVLQLAGKGVIATQLSPFQTDVVQAALALIPVALGGGAMWLYWRRATSPALLVAYGLFAGIDAICSLYILLPPVLWGT